MIGHDFPYLDTRDLNLDWLIKNMKQILLDWAEYQQTMNQSFADLEAANAAFKADINAAYDSLYDWFENLNVQTEINNKLDAMKRSGELADIMNPLIATQTAAWLEQHITNPTNPPIDTSLTVAGAAADSKAAGDEIFKLAGGLSVLNGAIFARNYRITIAYTNVTNGYYLDGTGRCVADDGYKLLKYPVTPGSLIWINATADTDGVYQFQSAKSVPSSLPNNNLIGEPVLTATNKIVAVPRGAAYCIISVTADNAVSGLYDFEPVFKDAATLKNLIGMDSTIKYPVFIPAGTTLTMSTADGENLGQSDLLFRTYGENGDMAQYWNFSSSSSTRTITTSANAYYIAWNRTPAKDVQVEIGSTKTRYVPYALNIINPEVIKTCLEGKVKPEELVRQSFNASFHMGATDFATKCTEYAALMYGDTIADVTAPAECEAFLFFTDPHLVQWSGWEDRCYELITQIQKYYNSTPTTFCLCGGDWLGNDDLPATACYKLGYIDGFMHSMFDNCYMLLGNHDTNYQGKLTADSERYTTRLSVQSIKDLWYRGENAYFSFKGAETKFYCFDTEIEGQSLDSDSDYGWIQCKWFADSLLTEDTAHLAVAGHILYTDLPTNSNVCPIMEEVLTIAEAYNTRSSIIVYGTTYDFTNATGKIDFCVCGHSHGDYNGVLHGIPYFLTINAGRLTDTASFDLVLVDYSNSVIRLVRVGSGENRSINLI